MKCFHNRLVVNLCSLDQEMLVLQQTDSFALRLLVVVFHTYRCSSQKMFVAEHVMQVIQPCWYLHNFRSTSQDFVVPVFFLPS
ncbi:hypothetical protein HanHA300_Chr14g0509061 [Helianthus annuus]|nr:hypothetical protein HanHA300_Chr14g0509061 [Helianthus annuus]